MKRLFLPAILIFSLLSCKKDHHGLTSRLSQIDFFSNDQLQSTTAYQYDAAGRIASESHSSNGGYTLSYQYNADSITVLLNNLPQRIYYVGSAGMIVSAKQIFPSPNPDQFTTNDSFEYDANANLVKKTEVFSQLYNGNTVNQTLQSDYSFTNSNMVKQVYDTYDDYSSFSQTEITQYSYTNYDVRPEILQVFNHAGLPFNTALAGHSSQKLVAEEKDENGQLKIKYAYKFDKTGRLTEMTITPFYGGGIPAKKVFHYAWY